MLPGMALHFPQLALDFLPEASNLDNLPGYGPFMAGEGFQGLQGKQYRQAQGRNGGEKADQYKLQNRPGPPERHVWEQRQVLTNW